MDEQHALTIYHLIATGGGGILATVGLIWRLWIVPAREKELALAVWQAKVEERLRNGEDKFQRHTDVDERILAKLESIEERLRRLETAFAGVAPALAKGGE